MIQRQQTLKDKCVLWCEATTQKTKMKSEKYLLFVKKFKNLSSGLQLWFDLRLLSAPCVIFYWCKMNIK